MDYTVTAAQLPAVLARLSVREDQERAAQQAYAVLRGLPRGLWAERAHA